MQEILANILKLSKEMSTDLGKLQIEVKELRKEGVQTVKNLMK